MAAAKASGSLCILSDISWRKARKKCMPFLNLLRTIQDDIFVVTLLNQTLRLLKGVAKFIFGVQMCFIFKNCVLSQQLRMHCVALGRLVSHLKRIYLDSLSVVYQKREKKTVDILSCIPFCIHFVPPLNVPSLRSC